MTPEGFFNPKILCSDVCIYKSSISFVNSGLGRAETITVSLTWSGGQSVGLRTGDFTNKQLCDFGGERSLSSLNLFISQSEGTHGDFIRFFPSLPYLGFFL